MERPRPIKRLGSKVGRSIDKVGAKVVESERISNATYRILTSRPGNAIRSRLERAQCARILREIRKRDVPQHVAIIMDGNRRYARKGGQVSTQGHLMGRDKLEEVLEWCLELEVRVLTVYAFSTENFKRDDEEVQLLMDLFERNYYRLADDPRVHKHRIRFRTIGKKELLPERVRKAAEHAEEATRGYDGYFFNVAVAYGGREEIVNAVRKIGQEIQDGTLTPQDIDQRLFASYLYTKELPDPDLILRTSGEERISNFLLWQAAYSELYFADVFWPGLRKKDFLRAIQAYQKRQRRFGGDDRKPGSDRDATERRSAGEPTT